jgi:peptide-methionine (S)-S-oxide reductase
MNGVSRAIVGYTGGKELDPTYRSIKDHTEAIFVEFDPKVLTYEDLVVEWSRMHTPVKKTKCQYRSAVWCVDEEQRETAEEILKGMKAACGQDVSSFVEKATRFYQAEDYHQNFIAKQRFG